jgi:hypothetical protein
MLVAGLAAGAAASEWAQSWLAGPWQGRTAAAEQECGSDVSLKCVGWSHHARLATAHRSQQLLPGWHVALPAAQHPTFKSNVISTMIVHTTCSTGRCFWKLGVNGFGSSPADAGLECVPEPLPSVSPGASGELHLQGQISTCVSNLLGGTSWHWETAGWESAVCQQMEWEAVLQHCAGCHHWTIRAHLGGMLAAEPARGFMAGAR